MPNHLVIKLQLFSCCKSPLKTVKLVENPIHFSFFYHFSFHYRLFCNYVQLFAQFKKICETILKAT